MSWKDFTKKYGEYKENSFLAYPMRRVWRIIVAKERPYLTNNITNYINEIPPNFNVELKEKFNQRNGLNSPSYKNFGGKYYSYKPPHVIFIKKRGNWRL